MCWSHSLTGWMGKLWVMLVQSWWCHVFADIYIVYNGSIYVERSHLTMEVVVCGTIAVHLFDSGWLWCFSGPLNACESFSPPGHQHKQIHERSFSRTSPHRCSNPQVTLQLLCHRWRLFKVFWISGGETQRDGLAAVARETDVRTAVSCLCCVTVWQRIHTCAIAPLSMCWISPIIYTWV